GRRAGIRCLLGRHHYGEDHEVGAGIQRRVCEVCAAVTIDLTRADEPSQDSVPTGRSTTSLGSDR
ncbi:MAG: hypothetical protein ACRDVL_13665, partial [Acidimicrobiia bacterium]